MNFWMRPVSQPCNELKNVRSDPESAMYRANSNDSERDKSVMDGYKLNDRHGRKAVIAQIT